MSDPSTLTAEDVAGQEACRCPKCSIPPRPSATPVTVTDFDRKFGTRIGFMFKWTFASIPALILICGVIWLALLGLAAAGIGLGSLLQR
jgi:hypothetical protein